MRPVPHAHIIKHVHAHSNVRGRIDVCKHPELRMVCGSIPDLARDGKSFSPWHFTNCKYWITKKESEVQMLNTYGAVYGLKSIAMPYVYDDVTLVDGEWNAQTQSEINGYVSGLLQRFPHDFIRSWKVKETLEKKDIIVHLHGGHVYDMDPMVAHEDPEFSKSKFTLHSVDVHPDELLASVLLTEQHGLLLTEWVRQIRQNLL